MSAHVSPASFMQAATCNIRQATSRIPLSPNACSQRIQPLLDPLVSPIDLMNVMDHALPLRAEGGQQQRHTGADVGAGDLRAGKPVAADDAGPMRVAEDDARSHLDQ